MVTAFMRILEEFPLIGGLYLGENHPESQIPPEVTWLGGGGRVGLVLS